MKIWRTYTQKIWETDVEDELLKPVIEEEVDLEISSIIAFYQSKYDGFLKVELNTGTFYTIKSTKEELRSDISLLELLK